MSDDSKTPEPPAEGKKPAEAPAEGPEAAATGPQAAAPAPNEVPSETDLLRMQMEALAAEVAELKDGLLRAHAEMDNLRKRGEREKLDVAKYAITKFAKDVITVGDTFQRASDTVPAEAADKDPALKSFLEGVLLAERDFLNTLERHGIRRLDPNGTPFNPYEHQAAGEEENPAVVAGTVVRVYQVGYMIEDRVLRPAMVVVSKGGPRAPAEAASAGANDNVKAEPDAPPPAAGKEGGDEPE